MKVLMVTNAIAPDKLGGLERYVRELAAALVRKGHDVTTLSKRTAPDQASAETGDDGGSVLDHGRAKLERKGCDVLVVNEVGTDKTFGRDDNTVHILRLGRTEPVCEIGPAGKDVIAHAVLDVVLDALNRR